MHNSFLEICDGCYKIKRESLLNNGIGRTRNVDDINSVLIYFNDSGLLSDRTTYSNLEFEVYKINHHNHNNSHTFNKLLSFSVPSYDFYQSRLRIADMSLRHLRHWVENHPNNDDFLYLKFSLTGDSEYSHRFSTDNDEDLPTVILVGRTPPENIRSKRDASSDAGLPSFCRTKDVTLSPQNYGRIRITRNVTIKTCVGFCWRCKSF